jgi:hypothetical protein
MKEKTQKEPGKTKSGTTTGGVYVPDLKVSSVKAFLSTFLAWQNTWPNSASLSFKYVRMDAMQPVIGPMIYQCVGENQVTEDTIASVSRVSSPISDIAASLFVSGFASFSIKVGPDRMGNVFDKLDVASIGELTEIVELANNVVSPGLEFFGPLRKKLGIEGKYSPPCSVSTWDDQKQEESVNAFLDAYEGWLRASWPMGFKVYEPDDVCTVCKLCYEVANLTIYQKEPWAVLAKNRLERMREIFVLECPIQEAMYESLM